MSPIPLRLAALPFALLLACSGPADDDGFASPSPTGPTPSPTDGPPALRLAWPMPGEDGSDWVINNYVDLDPTEGGIADYTGAKGDAAKTYDGHRGVDIDVPTFRAMDAGFPIFAAADGEVVAFADDEDDRHTECAGDWNYVTLLHDNGYQTVYGHLKRGSVVVAVGQRVAAGDTLGIVGSSGCSTAPHLHFEVHDALTKVRDPFLDGLWEAPPVYDTPLSIMDATLQAQAITDVDAIKDPPPDIDDAEVGQVLGLGVSAAGGAEGDGFTVAVRRPDGTHLYDLSRTFDTPYRHTYWYWNITPDNHPGTWRVDIAVGEQVTWSHAFHVTGTLAALSTHIAVPEEEYQGIFDDEVAAGFRPLWVDGTTVGEGALLNAVFVEDDGTPWVAYHGIDGATYKEALNARVDEGYRLAHVDTWTLDGALRYAAIFTKESGPGWRTYFGASPETHQQRLSEYADEGYRPVAISWATRGPDTFVAALYDKADVGGWAVSAGLTPEAFEAANAEQREGGRALSYLSGYDLGGEARLSAIWDGRTWGGWDVEQDLSQAQLSASLADHDSAEDRVVLVTAYPTSGGAAFAGLWRR